MNITFGDNVKVVSSPETDAIGVAGKLGQVYGETIPSVTSVEVIGKSDSDYAINVLLEETGETYWFAPHLLEFINHAEGTEVVIRNHKAVRRADGGWEESEIHKKKWWKFW
jgi:hypothetical protein